MEHLGRFYLPTICPLMWEGEENIAQKYPAEGEKAIPKLLEKLKDNSTAVRWYAAYALTEIAKYKPNKQNELVLIFKKFIRTEQNNGVRNVYAKALKEIDKQ